MITNKQILLEHKKTRGKISIKTKMSIGNKEKLSIAYTPGVAVVSKAIAKNKKLAYQYTNKGNLVAIITDGTAVLGLGDIGPEAAIAVMEGKAVLLKELAQVDAFPLSLNTKNEKEIIAIIKSLQVNFAAINLEDISAPRCFEIERTLIKELDIPVFHDDQHGTAIVVLAGLINAAKVVGKDLQNMKIAVAGAGAAGLAITKLLYKYGIKDIVVVDSKGIISKDRQDINIYKQEILVANKRNVKGFLADALAGADVFIGVAQAKILKEEMIRSMAERAIVFAMSNPIPEIMPNIAKRAGAAVVGTGRSDMPNQINNALVFPGLFRGLLDSKHKRVTDEMKILVAETLATMVARPTKDKIMPHVLDKKVSKTIAEAIKKLK